MDSEVSSEIPVHHISEFDFDDAFSVGDLNEIEYQLSPDAIREDLARNMPSLETSWSEEASASPNGSLEAEDLSVSTLDLNGSGPSSRSRSPSLRSVSRSSTSGSFKTPNKLSQVHLSLPSNGTEEWHRKTTENSIVDNISDNLYSNITIDASANKLHSHRVTLTSDLENRSDSGEHVVSSSTLEPPLPTQPLSTTVIPPLPFSSLPPAPNSDLTLPTSSASQPTLQPPQKLPGHKLTRTTGPSIFEQVRSKTRPTFLPPKPRQEDNKHMADWQSMMKHSRIAAEKRRKALQERRLQREKHIEDSILTWEKEIVPDWKVVHKTPALRKLWWKGIPTKLRASMWERAVGNALALSKDHYRTCLARAKRAIASGTFPPSSMTLIEEDISTTLPVLHIFHHENGPLYTELKEMLCAWVVSRSDEGLGYTLGAAKIAAMLLINMPPQSGFVVMRNLLERHCMRSFYGGEGSKEDTEAYYRIFDTLLADGMPKIYFNFKQHQISPSAYLNDWLLPLFLDHLPFEACARVWDVLMLEGDSFLYRAALAILAVLEPRLFFPDRRELMELLKGENKAALDIARREGQPLDGGKYEIYGVDEETLWERIDYMDEWWKESTWTRLLQRELPDL